MEEGHKNFRQKISFSKLRISGSNLVPVQAKVGQKNFHANNKVGNLRFGGTSS